MTVSMKKPRTPRQSTRSAETQRPDPGAAGQSGDTMGLSKDEAGGSESVTELVEEGQYFEAEALSGAERPYPDEAEVRTHEVPEDDVPLEYPPKDLDSD
jgi:hypothetical protein